MERAGRQCSHRYRRYGVAVVVAGAAAAHSIVGARQKRMDDNYFGVLVVAVADARRALWLQEHGAVRLHIAD